MTGSSVFTIRTMKPDDLEQALSLSIAEGWNQTGKDWKLLLEKQDNVCIVAEKDNRLVGTATALNHGNKVAWIGMVLVDKSLRGMGAGKMLLKSIIDRLGHVESVKLDATPAGEPLYRQLGFIAEYKIYRMGSGVNNSYSEVRVPASVTYTDNGVFREILKLDSSVFGADRSYLLHNLLNTYPGKAFYIKKGDNLEGYIFGRDGSRFSYIGPVTALSQQAARDLVSKALHSVAGQSAALDIPEDKEEMIGWLTAAGFVNQRHFVRMYLGRNPYPGIVSKQYLISGPEFG